MRAATARLKALSPSSKVPTALSAGVMLAMLALPAQAAPLLQDLSNRSLHCAAEAPYFIAPGGESIATLRYEDNSGGGWQDILVPLRAPVLKANTEDRLEVVLPAVPGLMKEERLVFVRTQEPPEQGSANRKRRTVISLHVNGDTVGDECAIEKGRPAYLENRFNTVRESVCGNDPAPACERLLKKTCGAEPTRACVTGVQPELEKVTKAYIDKLNARAGKPLPQGK